MRVTAENAIDVARLCVGQSSGCDLRLQPQPARVQPVKIAGKSLAAMIKFLDLRVKQFAYSADECVVRAEAIELMSVDREVPLALVLPDIALVNRNADQVRHDLRQPLVVVPLHPNDFDLALAVGKFSDLGKKHPMFAVEAAKIQVREDVTKQDQATILTGVQNCECVPRAADVRTEMNV